MDEVRGVVRDDRLQFCGSFVVELHGRRVSPAFPGRQARMLFAALVLARPQPVSRDTLTDVLWDDSPPAAAATALNVLVSKVRAAVGADVVRGRSQLAAALPESAIVDVEVAISAAHTAESAAAAGDWRRAWTAGLAAQLVTAREFLPGAAGSWADSWRRRLADVRVGALESYATACLGIGGSELPGAERALRELVAVAPFRETGHLLLMRTLAARGNVAEAVAAYERLRVLLRDELGVSPGPAIQDAYADLLG